MDMIDYRQALSCFAGKTENRFDHAARHAHSVGAPLLVGASAQLDCIVHARIDADDHEIMLGKVIRYNHTPAKPPLGYCHGQFFIANQQDASHA